MRYNISDDVMECKLNNQHSLITFPNKISCVEINNEKFEYKSFWNGTKYTKGYLHKIFEGEKNVYVRYFRSAYDKKTGKATIKYYLLLEENGKVPVKRNSTRMIVSNLYGNMNKVAKSYIKENHLNWRNPGDLKKTF